MFMVKFKIYNYFVSLFILQMLFLYRVYFQEPILVNNTNPKK